MRSRIEIITYRLYKLRKGGHQMKFEITPFHKKSDQVTYPQPHGSMDIFAYPHVNEEL